MGRWLLKCVITAVVWLALFMAGVAACILVGGAIRLVQGLVRGF